MKKIWKLCAFLPALFMMGVIFRFLHRQELSQVHSAMISVSGWSRRKEGSFIRNLKKGNRKAGR